MRRALVALATALLVVTAGCAGTMGTATPAADGTSGDDAASADGSTTSDSTAGDSGTVNVYVSDEPNDMDDFEHLNVTITTVAFHLVDAADDESADESEDGRWVTREVNVSEVDLSALRGANATLLEAFDLPAGEYNKVHMEVSEIDATLNNGDSQRVKLPSNRLQLNSEFTVENGSEVDFVYDVSVHEAGNSGKYILKPVVSESGTEVPIERVDDEREDEDSDDEGTERSIDASVLGNVTAGETVTVQVTENGTVVENATVMVDDERVGTTDANGKSVVNVPSDVEEFEITVEDGDAEAELEYEFEAGEESAADDDAGSQSADT